MTATLIILIALAAGVASLVVGAIAIRPRHRVRVSKVRPKADRFIRSIGE